MNWVQVLADNALAEGDRQVVKVSGESVLLLRHNGSLYAVASKCPHLKAPMKRGKITADGAIVCPFHRSAFDLKSGEVKDWCPFPPVVGNVLGKVKKENALPVFETKVEDGNIWVGTAA